MATMTSNQYKFALLKKEIDFDADTFKIILMQSGFNFNRVSHNGYADVSAYELATGLGYTAGGKVLSGVNVSRDDVLHKGKVTWDAPAWPVSGGSLVTSGAIIYDDTVGASTGIAADPIVGYIDFGGDQVTVDGGTFSVIAVQVTES